MYRHTRWFWSSLLCLGVLSGGGGAALAGPGNARGEAPRPPAGGYRIWHDGKLWHLRGVAGDRERRFHGALTIPGGTLSLSAVPEKQQVKILQRGGSLRFEFKTAGEAGLDFAAEAECVVLELMVDDRHLPELVRLGKAGVAPPLFPYEACR
jgi:hypothetical protein